jgi:hypothetical protein
MRHTSAKHPHNDIDLGKPYSAIASERIKFGSTSIS